MNIYVIEYTVDLGIAIVAILSSEEHANKLCADIEHKRIEKVKSNFGTVPEWLLYPQYKVVKYIVDDLSDIAYLYETNNF
jgi:quinol-cytochrome oxidoreductase complex cytochrome b subunit